MELRHLLTKSLTFLEDYLRQELRPYFKTPLFRYLRNIYIKYIIKYLRLIVPFFHCNVMVALTYHCQCRCGHCGISMYKLDQKEELRRSEIMNLIDVLSSLAVGEMYFFGGEPLLVPQLVDFVRYAKRKGLKTKLDTNAFLLDEDMVKKLKEAGIDLIGISIDSPYETIHDKLRGINGIFKRAVTGIKYCIKHNIECYMSIYATKDNLKNGDLEKLINLAKSLGVRSRILSSILCGKWINRKDLVLTSREIMLLRSLLENYMVYLERDDIDSKEIPFLCSALAKDLFFISAHGDVQPCCYLPVSFGNIREQPLINIIKRMWKSSMFVKQERYNDCPMNCKNFRDKYVN